MTRRLFLGLTALLPSVREALKAREVIPPPGKQILIPSGCAAPPQITFGHATLNREGMTELRKGCTFGPAKHSSIVLMNSDYEHLWKS